MKSDYIRFVPALVVLAVALVATGVYVYQTQIVSKPVPARTQNNQGIIKPTEQPTTEQNKITEQPQPENETAGWQTYRNDYLGFKIKYPKDWQVEKTMGDTKGIKIKKLTGESFLEIIKNSNTKKLSLDEWFEEATIVGGRPTVKVGAQATFINDIKAYKLYSGLEPPNPFFEVIGIANAQKMIFSINAYSENTNDEKILEEMLSTFKFIEPQDIDTADWQTYRNENWGVEMKIPSFLEIKAEENSSSFWGNKLWLHFNFKGLPDQNDKCVGKEFFVSYSVIDKNFCNANQEICEALRSDDFDKKMEVGVMFYGLKTESDSKMLLSYGGPSAGDTMDYCDWDDAMIQNGLSQMISTLKFVDVAE